VVVATQQRNARAGLTLPWHESRLAPIRRRSHLVAACTPEGPPKGGHYVRISRDVENESNARFGQLSDNNNIAFKPRLLQLGFRAAF
jgi:hypothetical protein